MPGHWTIRTLCAALALSCGIAGPPGAAAGADADATFLAISDVHLDPFTGTAADGRLLAADISEWPRIFADVSVPVATYGDDANVPLLDAVLADAARRTPSPDFVIFSGDAVVHRLAYRVRAVEPGAGQEQVTDMAIKITTYLAHRLADAFPQAPVLLALGNTDAGCGDYQVEPGGRYLAATVPALRRLVGSDRLAPDAEATWRAGGYYAARHPTVDDMTVIVLNTVLWSPKYENRCGPAGSDSRAAGDAMSAWLEARLSAAASAGERVWLVYHIPAGVDAYSTAQAKPADAACAAHTVPFWREPYAAAFASLMQRHRAIVSAGFSGHIHRDSWRLFPASGDGAAGFEAIVPAVSPVYRDAPAFQMFTYDRSDGALQEKTTFAVTNLPQAAAGAPVVVDRLYAFTEAYARTPFGATALAEVTAALQRDAASPDRTLYDRFYGSGYGHDPETDWPVYACAPAAATAGAFDACRCGPR
ncbi:metallophosphoesterase [Acuticoccus sp. I52.16.1]|uniref:metallophosphoesterase n=1 Tax=Acuticoccus sp. I52.16.1 TaxID=2928472 RepID=UPI001FD37C61|nr:metallophosphoesterase [Acuticoccus sp. I52.16.1]UOM32564.1 metallophosphoesterase [Acuticoccus sp. I52.16.1]